ncbi:MAG: PLD nuclease N-terminal domain-containing protein [Pseudomonadota bacterium]
MASVGLWGLLHIAAVVYALIKIVDSSADKMTKIIWVVIVALLPLVGLIAWLFMGPGTPKK